jgi:hypothetical protein
MSGVFGQSLGPRIDNSKAKLGADAGTGAQLITTPAFHCAYSFPQDAAASWLRCPKSGNIVSLGTQFQKFGDQASLGIPESVAI